MKHIITIIAIITLIASFMIKDTIWQMTVMYTSFVAIAIRYEIIRREETKESKK